MNQGIILQNQRNRKSSISGVTTGSEVFHTCCWLWLTAFFILPDGFGFQLGMLFSAKRIMLLVCFAMIVFDTKRLNLLWADIKSCMIPNIIISLYMAVRLYTALYRVDINTFAGEFLDGVLVFYLFVYIFRHEITVEQFLKFIRICLWILCIQGIWEYITHINLFGYLNIAGTENWGAANLRGGTNRISGPCHHAIHFGIYISVLFFLSCFDIKKNRLYLFSHPFLFIITTLCMFLCGSRAPLGIYLLGTVLICLFSRKDERIKSLLILGCVVSVFAIFLMVIYRTSLGRQIMYMLAAMYDAIFDTEYALNYSDTILRWSTEYRDALKKVFQVDYFNKIMGRGVSYQLSHVIDGYWLQSCDNSYVATYISLAYPGLVVLILHALTSFGYMCRGLIKYKSGLFAAGIVAFTCYYINIWYVAFMGTFMYMWMLFALIYVVYGNMRNEDMKNAIQSYQK